MERRVSDAPEKPLLIYDGDCNFCKRWIARWKLATGDRVDYISSQEIKGRSQFPEIARESFEGSVQLIETDGVIYESAEAVFRALAYSPRWQWLLYLFQHSSLFAKISDSAYRIVASHQTLFSTLTRLMLPAESSEYELTRSLFLRLLGLVYFCAFFSWIGQVSGLIGPTGIQPAREILQAEADQLHGFERWHQVPTLCWWLGAGDGSLQGQCAVGMFCSALLMLGFLPLPNLIVLWLLYLSQTVAGNLFMGFQWENLLLESGLIAVFFAPASWTIGRGHRTSWIGLFLLRWLTFRLMFESGWVKLGSGDPAWRTFRALDFHYETQPLPTMFGFFAHQMPHGVHAFSIIVMLIVELVLPFLIFGPRRGRLLCAGAFAALQLVISITGNYGFFNLLAVVLCIPLLDDAVIRKFFGSGAKPVLQRPAGPAIWSGGALFVRGLFLALVLLITSVQLLSMTQLMKTWSNSVRATYAFVYPVRSLNSYGLFAVMTTNRTEIEIQGSRDGKTWESYEFRYKPDDPVRRPRFTGTHMPRLDWQMWFAALGSYSENTWLVNLSFRLLQGDKKVLKLLRSNPFPEGPPRFIRAVTYEYHFTNLATQMKTGRWWTRVQTGIYLPALSLNASH